MRFRLFKDDSTLFQRIVAVAFLLFCLSTPVFIVFSIVLKRSNPLLSSLTDALATIEVGLLMSAVVIRSLLSGDVEYGQPGVWTLHERRRERPFGFWCVIVVFVLLAVGMVSKGIYRIARWGALPDINQQTATNLDVNDRANSMSVMREKGKSPSVMICKSSEGAIANITVVQSSGDSVVDQRILERAKALPLDVVRASTCATVGFSR